ncbi:MAG: NADH:ubiquinone reductase (Na(+)-transporting) subunit B [Alphaproteobacteria bacterium]
MSHNLSVTKSAPHIRSKMNIVKAFNYVILALIPVTLYGCYNVGYNAFRAASNNQGTLPDVRLKFFEYLGFLPDFNNIQACFFYGLMVFAPFFIVSLVLGKASEFIFAKIRGKELSGGILLTALLYSLTLPPTLSVWQAGVGIVFGVLVAREFFGGLGKNFINPALTARVFVFFSYPANMSGNRLWVAIDSYTGATGLGVAREGGMPALSEHYVWYDAFIGNIPGSIGETSALLCLIAAVFLILTRVANWRIIFGVWFGVMFMSGLFNLVAHISSSFINIPVKPMFYMTWPWHMVLGGLAFGAVFMATDPVSSCQTNGGRLFYGFFIGVMTVLIRVTGTSFAEGIMLAILLGNICAPLIDYVVVRNNIRRRLKKNVS